MWVYLFHLLLRNLHLRFLPHLRCSPFRDIAGYHQRIAEGPKAGERRHDLYVTVNTFIIRLHFTYCLCGIFRECYLPFLPFLVASGRAVPVFIVVVILSLCIVVLSVRMEASAILDWPLTDPLSVSLLLHACMAIPNKDLILQEKDFYFSYDWFWWAMWFQIFQITCPCQIKNSIIENQQKLSSWRNYLPIGRIMLRKEESIQKIAHLMLHSFEATLTPA